MKTYLLLLMSFMFLLFALPKNSSMRSFAQQAAVVKSCNVNKGLGKKPCARKCLQHQTHSGKHNAAGTASDCSQQLYALVELQQQTSGVLVTSHLDFILPRPRQHLSPVLERYPEPPRFS